MSLINALGSLQIKYVQYMANNFIGYVHRHTENFLPGGGGRKPFAQKILASDPNFLQKSRKETGAILQQHRPHWRMKVARYSFSGSIPDTSR